MNQIKFNCFATFLDENVKLTEKFAENSIQSRMITSFEGLNSLIVAPITTRQGFVVTEGCLNVIDEYIAQENHLIVFKDYNIWLFIDDRLDLSEGVKVSVDVKDGECMQ